MAFDFLSTERFVEIDGFALAQPPTWTRLEPQTVTGDPEPGIENRVHDPLWLLGRQWQLGELEGEDAGTPLAVRVVTSSVAVDRWAAGDAGAVRSFGRTAPEVLEPEVEREPVGSPPGLRARAEAAAVLMAALDDAGLGAYRAVFAANCPLDVTSPDPHAALDPTWVRLARLLGGRAVADAGLISADLDRPRPAWLVDAPGLSAVLDAWLAWYRAEVSPPPGGDDAWVGERLEYRFRIGAGETVLDAPAHGGGDIDWYTFDPGAALAEPDAAPDRPPVRRDVHRLLASPLRYPGMPADRLWEIEDGQVNLGVVEAEPWDLARLLVAEFALTYGNDWLVVPVDVSYGSLTTVESVYYTTTFGERFAVRPTTATTPDAHWRMFTLAAATGATVDGLLAPPAAVAVTDGPAVEEVLFLRDEMANLAWAVELSVEGPSGTARDRAREADDVHLPPVGPVASAQLDYLLQTGVPARWIPYLPRSSGYRSIDLVQGRMPAADGTPVNPLGRVLADPGAAALKDAEVPREGVLVRRQPSVTRLADGSYVRWTTRRVSVGRGEGASRLAFDSALSRQHR